MVDPDLERRLEALRRVLGSRRPDAITQQASDYDDAHLHRLLRLRPDKPPRPMDLFDYVEDLLYRPIDVPLLRYLLPVCLRAWHARLLDPASEGVSDSFYPVLADRDIFDGHLTAPQSAAVAAFLRDSVLLAIDHQRGLTFAGNRDTRPYDWIGAWTTYAVLRPDVSALCREWWRLDTVGRAVAFVQFASVLAYEDGHNPVFAPWTPDRGGGPPVLWAFSGHLYEHRWLEPNVAFLRGILDVRFVADGVRRAAAQLSAEPERAMAARVVAELPARQATLAHRCAELPNLLGTRQTPDFTPEWSASS